MNRLVRIKYYPGEKIMTKIRRDRRNVRQRSQSGGHAHNSPGIKYHYHDFHYSGDKTRGAKFYDPNDGQGGGGLGVPVDHWIGVQTAAYYTDEPGAPPGWSHDWDPNSNNYGDPLYPQPQGTLPHHGHGSSTINPNPRGGGNTGGGTGGNLMGDYSGRRRHRRGQRRPDSRRASTRYETGGRVGRKINMNNSGMIGNPTPTQQNAAAPTRNAPIKNTGGRQLHHSSPLEIQRGLSLLRRGAIPNHTYILASGRKLIIQQDGVMDMQPNSAPITEDDWAQIDRIWSR